MNLPNLNLYTVSDSSGETVIAVSKAVISQFDNITVQEYMWPLVRSKEQINEIAAALEKKPGIVIYTILRVGAGLELGIGPYL